MSEATLLGVPALLLLAGMLTLIPLGLRTGERPGDALLLDARPRAAPRGAAVTVSNPGRAAVLVGISLRQAGPRLRLEGGSYVRIRTGSTAPELLPAGQTGIGVLDAGETRTFVVQAGARIGRRAEVVVVVGQRERLRTIHRLVVLAQLGVGSGARAGHRGATHAGAPRVGEPPACRRRAGRRH